MMAGAGARGACMYVTRSMPQARTHVHGHACGPCYILVRPERPSNQEAAERASLRTACATDAGVHLGRCWQMHPCRQAWSGLATALPIKPMHSGASAESACRHARPWWPHLHGPQPARPPVIRPAAVQRTAARHLAGQPVAAAFCVLAVAVGTHAHMHARSHVQLRVFQQHEPPPSIL